MKKLLNILSLTVFLIFFLAACTKNTEKFTPYTTAELNDINWSNTQMPMAKQQAIITALSKPNYTHNFNAINGDTVTFNNQLQLTFPANSCLQNGLNYTGVVTTNLKQFLTKGDYIRNLASSCNTNKLYDSKGVFILNISDINSTALTLSNGSQYDLSLADPNIAQGYIFVSGSNISNNPDSIFWNVADSFENGYLTNTSILINGQYKKAYQIKSKKLNYINIAAPINTASVVGFNVVLGVNNFTNKNTAVFAVFKNYNTVIKLKSDNNSHSFVAENMPLGSEINLVTLSYIDGQFYISNKAIIVTNAAKYAINASVTPISLLALNNFLDAL